MKGIILINGYPGVGKLTISKELQRLLPNSRVFSNHNLIDTAAALFERDHPLYYTFRQSLRQTVFSILTQAHNLPLLSSPQNTLSYPIFTEVQSDNPSGIPVIHEYLSFAQQLKLPLYYIILSCSADENEKRLTSRKPSEGVTKLLDKSILQEIRRAEIIYHLENDIPGVVQVEILVDGLGPEKVAKRIVEELGLFTESGTGLNMSSRDEAHSLKVKVDGEATSQPLSIASTPHNPPEPEPVIQTLDVGGGNIVKLDALGPMIINSDGTLSRIQNWQDLHPIEQERTVRLLVKKRNLVRLQKLEAEDEKAAREEKLSILSEAEVDSAKKA